MARPHSRGASHLKSVVLDASVALGAVLSDEDDAFARAAVREALTGGIVVPALWPYEVQNGLLLAIRRDRLDAAGLRDVFATLSGWPIRLEAPHAFGEELRLAQELRITAYDASYLLVARRNDARLATKDKRLQAASRTLGVDLL